MNRRAFLGMLTGTLSATPLLVLAPPAHGEGGWVLWSQSGKGARADHTVVDSFPANVPGKPNVICARWARTFAQKPEHRDQTFICLPENVDPRGPKGEAKREKPRRR